MESGEATGVRCLARRNQAKSPFRPVLLNLPLLGRFEGLIRAKGLELALTVRKWIS